MVKIKLTEQFHVFYCLLVDHSLIELFRMFQVSPSNLLWNSCWMLNRRLGFHLNLGIANAFLRLLIYLPFSMFLLVCSFALFKLCTIAQNQYMF